MDAVTLLRQALVAGLELEPAGDGRLTVRGPVRLEALSGGGGGDSS
jgi:hypothetical protein